MPHETPTGVPPNLTEASYQLLGKMAAVASLAVTSGGLAIRLEGRGLEDAIRRVAQALPAIEQAARNDTPHGSYVVELKADHEALTRHVADLQTRVGQLLGERDQARSVVETLQTEREGLRDALATAKIMARDERTQRQEVQSELRRQTRNLTVWRGTVEAAWQGLIPDVDNTVVQIRLDSRRMLEAGKRVTIVDDL